MLNTFINSKPMTKSKIVLSIILIIFAVLLLGKYLPVGGDWHEHYRPATLALLSGASPYDNLGIYNPPWVFLPLIPLALLPEKLGSTLLYFIALVGYLVILRNLKVNITISIIFFLSPPVLIDIQSNNISWLVMLGYIMPPQIGLFFVLLKPQIGLMVALYWLVEAWRNGGIKQVIKTFLPVTIAFLISFAIYGLWIVDSNNLVNVRWNASLFPLSIPIGLVLLSLALRKREIRYAFMASPFFSPYVSFSSYTTVILGLTASLWDTIIATIGLWVVFILEYQYITW